MADTHAKMTQATPQEVIISIVAGLLAPLLAIFLIVQLVLGIQQEHQADASSAAAQQATVERIKPFAQLVALDPNAPRVERTGQQVYDAVCTSCHAAGALGAPKFDSKGDWGARIGQGFDTLVKHAINGIRQMPARGGDPDLSDIEVAPSPTWPIPAAPSSRSRKPRRPLQPRHRLPPPQQQHLQHPPQRPKRNKRASQRHTQGQGHKRPGSRGNEDAHRERAAPAGHAAYAGRRRGLHVPAQLNVHGPHVSPLRQ